MPDTLQKQLDSLEIDLSLALFRYENSKRAEAARFAFPWTEASEQAFAGATFSATCETGQGASGAGQVLCMRYRVTSEPAADMSVGLSLTLKSWSAENYVLAPAAAYAGNRFRVADTQRVEQFPYPFEADMPITMTPVPRLNVDEGPSRLQLMSSDCSTPALGFFDPSRRKGFFLLTDQGTAYGNHSFALEENADRTQAEIVFKAPGVREETVYRDRPSDDRGADFADGDVIEFPVGLYVFDCESIQGLYDRYVDIMDDLVPAPEAVKQLPFSEAWFKQERKYNRQNWVQKYGYYSVGMRESRPQDWQTGWTGGMNAIYPLLAEGDAVTQARAKRAFDFLFETGITPLGFFYSCFHEGEWDGCFLRHTSDAIFFIIKSYLLLQQRGEEVPAHWRDAARGCLDAYQTLWDRYGQFGQRINASTGEIRMGETASNGIACAALALGAHYFNEPSYLDLARKAARRYRDEFVSKGITNGGPGDILTAPDSESAFGLLEAYAVLYEETGEEEWLEAAGDTARQCATWVTNYDYVFPADTTFGRLDMRTDGTVWANVQNKHSAPGICSLSGDSLLKLYRATGDTRYLDLIRRIAHALPQYLGRDDRRIPARHGIWPYMDDGWMNERVNMSDWEVCGGAGGIAVGEIFGGSCWSEVAMMLTHAELPGVYIDLDTHTLYAFDHVEADLFQGEHNRWTLRLENPTAFDASVKLLAESEEERTAPLGVCAMHDVIRVPVPAGGGIEVFLDEIAPGA